MPDLTQYYFFLSQLTAPLRLALADLSYDIQIPFLAAFILGIVGAFSPCQLSTNVAAFAFIARDAGNEKRITRSTVAYVLGKVLVYSVVGGATILLGVKLSQVSIPVVVFTRRALGPILIVLGLLMLGVIRLSLPVFAQISERLRHNLVDQHDARGSFLLGIAFAFAACPTLFVLFFSTMIPLALSSFGGITFPAIFAIGTSVPLMVFIMLAALGAPSITPFVQRLRVLNVWVSRLAAIIFILVGVNEILLYWFL